MLKELDTVELIVPLPEANLNVGRRGAVVMVYGNHEAYEVEFYNADWQWTPDMDVPYPAVLTTATPDKVRLVHRRRQQRANTLSPIFVGAVLEPPSPDHRVLATALCRRTRAVQAPPLRDTGRAGCYDIAIAKA